MYVLFFLCAIFQYVHAATLSSNALLKRDRRSPSTNFGPDSTYLSANGLTCYVCRPGFYRKSDCNINGTTAVCERCTFGQYSSTYNIAIRCADCSPHCVDKNAEVHRVCNSTADMTCRCKDGFYNHSKGGGEFICVPHSKCPPGQEMHRIGTLESDTQCRPCEPGTLSPVTSLDKCKPCSTCTSDQMVTLPCDGTKDTVCKHKGNVSASHIAIPVVLSIAMVVVVVLIVVLWRKGKLQKLNRLFRKSKNETIETEGNSRDIADIQRVEERLGDEDTQPQKDKVQIETWTQVFKMVSRDININEWKSVMRTLLAKVTTSENTIETICYDYRHDTVKEQIYQCLLKWQKLCDEVFLDDVVAALDADNMLGLADKLQKMFPSLLRKNTCSEVTTNEYSYGD